MKPHAWILLLLLSLAAIPGCAMNDTRELPEPRVGVVTDMAAFETFLELVPTPDEFRDVYPDVVLILPGDIATREYRTDNSRYFADLDEDGRITGGSFQ